MNLAKTYHGVTQRSTFWLAFIWLLTLPALWYSLNAASELRVDVGQWGDHAIMRGVHGREANPFEDYRWTEAHTTIAFPNLNNRYRILQIRAHGWRPEGIPTPCVQIVIAERQWVTFQADRALRTYVMLLPGAALSPTVEVSLISETYTPPDDTRTIGIAIDWVTLHALDVPDGLALGQFAGQALLLALALALIALLALPGVVALACGLLASAALGGLNIVEPLWVGLGLIHWLVVVALLAGA
ncbi:MAG: hypothetical protein RMJ55_13570, partial [Roseiflexaceae bacterium]|nr:hypothetical protein [Roseiflexaceae bacterium]